MRGFASQCLVVGRFDPLHLTIAQFGYCELSCCHTATPLHVLGRIFLEGRISCPARRWKTPVTTYLGKGTTSSLPWAKPKGAV